jgi:hypothetical protein
MSAPEQTVILFLDSAPTRGNLEALIIFRERNIMVMAFPPHLTHILQPVDVAWASRFKSQFRDSRRHWREARITSYLSLLLGRDQADTTPTMLTRTLVVGAAVDAAQSAAIRSVCTAGFVVSGLVGREGRFPSTDPLSSAYVRPSEDDLELDARVKRGGGYSSSVRE